MNDVIYYIRNGYHIVLFSIISHFMINDFKLNMYIFLKVFSINYYNSFKTLYPNPEYYKWKHMIRLTDTGHFSNFLFYFYPNLLPISHNILFVITTAYYITRLFFNLKDLDDRDNKYIDTNIQNIYCHLNHTLPYTIILYSIYENKKNNIYIYIFDETSFLYSLIWILSWFIFIYLPWVYYTGDYVYSVLDKKTPTLVRGFIIFMVILLVKIANEFGKLIT